MKGTSIIVAFVALVWAAPANAHLLAKPKCDTVKCRLASQQANLRHVKGVLAATKRVPASDLTLEHQREVRFAKRAAGWLPREIRETKAAIAARMVVNDYMTAVRLVERYFGYQSFLRSCPRSEGGFGQFVYNTQGSGAGGWLQFMEGTFWSVIDDAIRHARERGMFVPSSARSWYSPLGQALAGIEMLRDGRRGEWSGSTC